VVRDIASGPDSEVSSVLPVEFRRELFGDPAKILDSDINPEVLFRKLKESGADIPKIYMACGTEDNLIDSNRYFADFLKTEGADVIFEEGPGRHTWQFWNEYIDRGLKALLG
jgi:S-formylglutathione hydrolase FrmB